MENNFFDKESYENLLQRVHTLTPESLRQWGVMTVNQMLCHITDPFRDLLGLRDTKPTVPFFLWPIVKMILLAKRPFAKNAPTLKPYLQKDGGKGTPPTTFDNDKQMLLDMMTQCYNTPEDFKFRPHPGAGPVNRKQAGTILWKHTDHHLRQFGV